MSERVALVVFDNQAGPVIENASEEISEEIVTRCFEAGQPTPGFSVHVICEEVGLIFIAFYHVQPVEGARNARMRAILVGLLLNPHLPRKVRAFTVGCKMHFYQAQDQSPAVGFADLRALLDAYYSRGNLKLFNHVQLEFNTDACAAFQDDMAPCHLSRILEYVLLGKSVIFSCSGGSRLVLLFRQLLASYAQIVYLEFIYEADCTPSLRDTTDAGKQRDGCASCPAQCIAALLPVLTPVLPKGKQVLLVDSAFSEKATARCCFLYQNLAVEYLKLVINAAIMAHMGNQDAAAQLLAGLVPDAKITKFVGAFKR